MTQGAALYLTAGATLAAGSLVIGLVDPARHTAVMGPLWGLLGLVGGCWLAGRAGGVVWRWARVSWGIWVGWWRDRR